SHLNALKLPRNKQVVCLFAIDADTFVESYEMRRSIESGAISGRLQDSLQHGASGALSIGSTHRDYYTGQRKIETLGDLTYTVQPQFYGAWMQLLQIGQPFVQCRVTTRQR